MFVCLPVGVSAAGSDTVTVSGSIGISIDVSASQKTIDFASMAAGVDESGQSTITVATTSTSWSVTASDARATTKGYMYRTGDVKLASPFRLSKDNSVFTPLTSDISNFMSGTSAGTFNQIAYVKQSISPADSSGSYSITTTFTGSAT
jgi:hypothetical protein